MFSLVLSLFVFYFVCGVLGQTEMCVCVKWNTSFFFLRLLGFVLCLERPYSFLNCKLVYLLWLLHFIFMFNSLMQHHLFQYKVWRGDPTSLCFQVAPFIEEFIFPLNLKYLICNILNSCMPHFCIFQSVSLNHIIHS
jgi:hypothetical protein